MSVFQGEVSFGVVEAIFGPQATWRVKKLDALSNAKYLITGRYLIKPLMWIDLNKQSGDNKLLCGRPK